MKQVLFLSIAIVITQISIAQERIFKKFKTDVSIGYAMPKGEKVDGGALFAIEPKYAILDQINVGLRLEIAVTANVDAGGEEFDATANGSYILTGDYYFSNNKFRPFAGIGGGYYTTAVADENTEVPEGGKFPTESNFGFMGRVGAEYNVLPKDAGYFGLKLGVIIGGGRL